MPQWEKIVGKHPVLEAIKAERGIVEIMVAEGGQDAAKEVLEAARSEGIPVKVVARKKIEQEAPGQTHQGVIAYAKARDYATVEELFAVAEAAKQAPLIVAVDGVEDPQNIGALLRVAHQAGAHGLLLGTRNTSPLTPAAVKVSAGASEHMKVARVPSLPNALLDIQRKQRAWILGMDAHEGVTYFDTRLVGPLVLIVGSEESGLSPLVRERCDAFLKVPMKGKLDSLNLSSAAAVVLFERLRQEAQGVPGKKTKA